MQKIPTYDEIKEFYDGYWNDVLNKKPDGIYEWTQTREMTLRIFAVQMSGSVRETAWKYCKTIANYSHCPVSPSEYRRMKKFEDEFGLIDVLLEALSGYYPDEKGNRRFDVMGFYYSVALISQSSYRREDCLSLLEKLVDFELKNKQDKYGVLLRNMKVLSKEYPDLDKFKKTLEDAV